MKPIKEWREGDIIVLFNCTLAVVITLNPIIIINCLLFFFQGLATSRILYINYTHPYAKILRKEKRMSKIIELCIKGRLIELSMDGKVVAPKIWFHPKFYAAKLKFLCGISKNYRKDLEEIREDLMKDELPKGT